MSLVIKNIFFLFACGNSYLQLSAVKLYFTMRQPRLGNEPDRASSPLAGAL